MVKLLGSTKNKITKDTNCENEPHLQITKVVLVHCKIVSNDYQHDTRVLHTFFPEKLFKNILNTEIFHNKVEITDQNSKLLEIENKHYCSY